MNADVKVMFVCLGNICRSPMAEAVFRHLVAERGLSDRVQVDSCGTGSWHVGNPPHAGTRRILTENGIAFDGIRAATLDPRSAAAFDYIVAMDRSNVRDLVRAGVPGDRITLLTDFIPGKEGVEVPDPYYTGNFEEVFELVREGTESLLQRIIDERGWQGAVDPR